MYGRLTLERVLSNETIAAVQRWADKNPGDVMAWYKCTGKISPAIDSDGEFDTVTQIVRMTKGDLYRSIKMTSRVGTVSKTFVSTAHYLLSKTLEEMWEGVRKFDAPHKFRDQVEAGSYKPWADKGAVRWDHDAFDCEEISPKRVPRVLQREIDALTECKAAQLSADDKEVDGGGGDLGPPPDDEGPIPTPPGGPGGGDGT